MSFKPKRLLLLESTRTVMFSITAKVFFVTLGSHEAGLKHTWGIPRWVNRTLYTFCCHGFLLSFCFGHTHAVFQEVSVAIESSKFFWFLQCWHAWDAWIFLLYLVIDIIASIGFMTINGNFSYVYIVPFRILRHPLIHLGLYFSVFLMGAGCSVKEKPKASWTSLHTVLGTWSSRVLKSKRIPRRNWSGL